MKQMQQKIFGREPEISLLNGFFQSDSAEFLAIYGRRRVGKTFLIRHFFSSQSDLVFFNCTGMKDGSMAQQLENFTEEIGSAFLYQGAKLDVGKNWKEVFSVLTDNIRATPTSHKIVLFFDELPWMATKNSRLLQNIDYFWNQHWSKDDRVKLVVCGSSASWVIKNIINNKGGLHNRVTQTIFLEPLKLHQTKKFLENLSVSMTNKQVADLFMVMGGVPFYLKKAAIRGLSATQIIESLAFRQKSFLLSEFENLYAALFSDADIYIKIVREISKHRYGIGQEDLFKKIGKSMGGQGGTAKMKALIDTSFIISFKPIYSKKKGIYYRVIDQYTLFYFHWILPVKESLVMRGLGKGYWDKSKSKPSWIAWSGLAFESICYEHIAQISQHLGLSPTALPGTWRYIPRAGINIRGAQIDLLFDRDDDAITICEIKYSDKAFVITKEYSEKLKQKIEIFKEVTRTKKQIFLVFIAANGLNKNKYSSEMVDGVVTLDDLFKDV